MLIESTFWQTTDKVAIAIERLQAFCPPEGYFLAFSGGKDSIVIKHLADMAGVQYDAHFNMTTADPPELLGMVYSYISPVIGNDSILIIYMSNVPLYLLT